MNRKDGETNSSVHEKFGMSIKGEGANLGMEEVIKHIF